MANNNPVSAQMPPAKLMATVALQSGSSVPEDFTVLAEALVARFGDSLDAVMLYGSCLHSCSLDEGIADLYVVVDNYRHAYAERHLALLNAWLAPNVFYLEVPSQKKTLRAKYAVISTADFEQGARHWFHPYIWARFAQPSRLLYVRNESSRQHIHKAMAYAVITFLKNSAAALDTACEVTVEEIWTHGLKLTYAAELRPENESRMIDGALLSLRAR